MLSALREGGSVREASRDVVAKAVSTKAGLRIVNSAYNLLGDGGKHRLYLLYAKIFSERAQKVYPGEWRVSAPGGKLKVVFGNSRDWLDWDLALSLLGHDQEVKNTYAAILGSELRPTQFVDVGTNYGSHSLLVANAGIPTLSFEPNPECISYYEDWAKENGISPHIEAVALGNAHGEVSFDFPPTATWLGMVSNGDELPEGYRRITVPVRRLDDYLDALAPGRLLIKLDAEGAEPDIIRGADRIIADRKPLIIFECWPDPTARAAIVHAFGGRFAFYSLPWTPGCKRVPMDEKAFSTDPATNFIAVPV